MRARLDFALAQTPRLYARLLRRRRHVDRDKLAFLALVRRGDVVLDVGANTGYYTLLFSHLVGRQGRVHAFEPVPPTFAVLAARLEREGVFANVVPNELALAAEDGPLPVFVPGSDHGQASITPHHAGSWLLAEAERRYDCRAATIDGYLRARRLGPPAFIKCDVEGAELRVLEGAVETLRARPPLLHLEVNPDWSRDLGYAPPDLVRFLAGFGYSLFFLVGESVRRLAEPARELACFRGSANLICGVPALHGARLRRLPPLLREAGRGTAAGGKPAGAG